MSLVATAGLRPSWSTFVPALLLAVGGSMLSPQLLRAGDAETRVFSIHIDGRKCGDYTLAIQKKDGTVTVAAQSNVRVTVLSVPVYTYSYTGNEVWKDGRLQHLASSSKEKGKESSLRADLDGTTLRVVANGKESRVRADAWPTSCWQLPPTSFRAGAVPLFGCDTGAELAGKVEYVGKENLTIAGKTVSCVRYRVTKDVPHDIWYDAQERIVRDEWVSGGHKTVMEMTELRQ